MSDFLYIIAEGVQDVAFIGKLLTVHHGAARLKRMEDLGADHAAWMSSFKWPIKSALGTDIERFSVPAPTFYRVAPDITVVLRSAGSIEKIYNTLEVDVESFVRGASGPATVGILLDSDDEPAETRLGKLRTSLAALALDVPGSFATVGNGTPRVGVFAAPEPGVAGTLEDLLLMIGDVSYPELAASARAYAEGWRTRAQTDLKGSDWSLMRKPAGGKKAAVAAMTAILKPGYAAQVSIEQNRWLGEHTKRLPGLKPFADFLAALLATVTPAAAPVPARAPGS